MKKKIDHYDHKDKDRLNNPPIGLVTAETDKDEGKQRYAYDPHIDPALMFDSQRSEIENIIDGGLLAEDLDEAKNALQELKRRQEPYLNWAGKAERTTFDVPTVSLHVHERIDPHTIIDNVRKRNGDGQPQLSLFELPEENPPVRTAIEFYKHRHNWSNRLIAGDSLLVMNSLLEKEGMAGKVQMIYIDPPYGIKYGSNFQPFVNKRDVTDGRDEDLTAEPEMIRAFRDTWELGIHSYLSYLRDRLFLVRELLSDSGSIFIQISDENVHHVRELMDEVFGVRNFCLMITYQKTGGIPGGLISPTYDYIVWYGKDKTKIKFNQIFLTRDIGDKSLDRYDKIELNDGTERRLTRDEIAGKTSIPNGKRFQLTSLFSEGASPKGEPPFTFNGKTYYPATGKHWTTTIEGLSTLAYKDRIRIMGSVLRYKRYLDDFPVTLLTDRWDSIQLGTERLYIVQTSILAVQRCILMTTDPGDLVFDPTCGSGTTAFVSEKWGRRWITCDTSRVAITLAKQRLMTSNYDYYQLAHPDEGVGSGFKYETVPHITLKSIANNEPPAQETLYDKPYKDTSKARVTGPFTVEAVPAPTVKPLSEIEDIPISDESISRSGETLRHAEWKDELLRTGIRGKNGQYILFSRIETLPGTRYLHAEGETKPSDRGADHVREESVSYGQPQRVVISFGPEHAPLEQRQVELAINEAQTLVPKPNIIVFAAFQFDPEAAKDIDETKWPGVTLLKAQMNADLLTEDLKKKKASNDSFWLMGQPDVRVLKVEEGKDKGKYRVEVHGFDYYNTKTGNVESGSKEKIALWMLDSDYDGRSLFPKQVFFPMAGQKEGWSRLKRTLRAEIDEDLIEAYHGTVSLPFEAGEYKKIAVKIVDDRGIESLKIIDIG